MSVDVDDDYELFTSLRYDPQLLTETFNTEFTGEPSPYPLFEYHVHRLIDAAAIFEWPLAIETTSAGDILDTLREKCNEAVALHDGDDGGTGESPLRVRLCTMIAFVVYLHVRSISCGSC